jgi:hypothetical protein
MSNELAAAIEPGGAVEFSATRIEIGKALLKAQREIGPLVKTESNPFFNSKYADLANVIEVVRSPLQEAGIVLVQGACRGSEDLVLIETLLLHAESGEWVRTLVSMKPAKSDPQSVGSVITYARRYGLQALCGIAPEDDDGNAASKPQQSIDDRVAQSSAKGPYPNAFTNPKSGKPIPAGGTPETHGQVKLLGTVIKWAEVRPPENPAKDKRNVYFAGSEGGRTLWTKEEPCGEMLLHAKGSPVDLTLIPSTTKKNTFQVVHVSIPDEMPESPTQSETEENGEQE